MTSEEKRRLALAKISEESKKRKLELRFKQSSENASIKQLAKDLEKEINKQIREDEVIFIYHVSHQLTRYGVPHFRSYDKKRFNGMTIAFIAKNDGTLSRIYSAFCDKEDTYSRSFGRLKVLTRIQKDLDNTQKGIKSSKFSPVILDAKEAFKYVDPLCGNTDHHTIVRAAIDWFITNHVNKPKKSKPVSYTRKQVLEVEDVISRRAEKELRNIADIRVVYQHEGPNPYTASIPRILRFVERGRIPEEREATIAKLALASTERNNNLPEDVKASLTEMLAEVTAKVYRHEGDQPNRVNARMFALKKLNKEAF